MRPIVLFRHELTLEPELAAARRHLSVIEQRAAVPPGSLIIPRYSAPPFYREFERDVLLLGGRLLNSYAQHRYVADIGQWVEQLRDLTPQTWRSVADVPISGYPIVLKGETNSCKFAWDTSMFAADRAAATQALLRLQQDSMVGQQHIYARRFEPLRLVQPYTFTTAPPVANEYRCFVLDGELLAFGYYWINAVTGDEAAVLEAEARPHVEQLVRTVADRIGDRCRFYVVDVAERADGEWIVIELNDGQQAGLSNVDADQLYSELARRLIA